MKAHRIFVFAIVLLVFCVAAPLASAATIVTKSYKIAVTENCDEDVACQDVTFTARSISDGRYIRLKGRAVTSLCNDGATPCHHQGYEFVDGNTSYFVSDDDWLEISQSGKVILHEEFVSYKRD